MRRACGHRASRVVALVGIASSGCLAEAWPNDDGRSVEGCSAERPLPVIVQGNDITVAATDATVTLHRISVVGSGSEYVGAIALQDGQGTVDIGCETMRFAVYSKYASTTDAWFYGLAIASDRLYPLAFGCTYDGVLESVYYGGTDGTAFEAEGAAGTCFEPAEPTVAVVRLPPLRAPYPPPVRGYTIDGSTISLSETGRGTVMVGSVEHELLPFVVECNEGCGNSARHDLHSLLWDAQGGRLSYAIVRLWPDSPELITLDVAVTLPGFILGTAERRSATVTAP
jgi:hypothetical protein